jgi:hypothetical protein
MLSKLLTSASIPALQAVVQSDATIRSEYEAGGVQVVRANFYSNIPTVADIDGSFEYASQDLMQAPYLASLAPDSALLASWLDRLAVHTEAFAPPADDDEGKPKGYFLNNSQFSHSDAFAYWAMLREIKPRKVLEIGCGFSTLLACEAIELNNLGSNSESESLPPPR